MRTVVESAVKSDRRAGPIVRVEGLRFAYPSGTFSLAVDDLTIERGERVACIGPSGAGKTTLIHLIVGIEVPDAGSVTLDGALVSALPDQERRARRIRSVGMVFQTLELIEYLTALDNILLPFLIAPRLEAAAGAPERARALASATGIEHVLARRPRHLSQGERQRVALCRALVTRPRLVVCDEPTGNLDPEASRAALDLVLEQTRAHDASLLMVTHDHGLLEPFERVIDVRELAPSRAEEAR